MSLRAASGATGARGFTLIELMIVLLIFTLVALIVIPSVEGAVGIKLREEAGALGGTIRAMYGEAVLQGKTCRLVMDLDARAYWPECSDGKAKLKPIEQSIGGIRAADDAKDALGDDEDEEKRRVAQRNAFSSYSAALAARHTLPEGVAFESVWTQHQEEPWVGGQAVLYFFPHGQSEKAYIYLTDGDETYTVTVHPMTGRTKVAAEKLPLPDRGRP